jgi:hypothetical protein
MEPPAIAVCALAGMACIQPSITGEWPNTPAITAADLVGTQIDLIRSSEPGSWPRAAPTGCTDTEVIEQTNEFLGLRRPTGECLYANGLLLICLCTVIELLMQKFMPPPFKGMALSHETEFSMVPGGVGSNFKR